MKISKKGVSLPELLAVIVIMGLIALIAIPAFTSTIKNTEKNAEVSTVKSLFDRLNTEVNANDIKEDADLDKLDWSSIEKDDFGGTMPFGITKSNLSFVGVDFEFTIDLSNASGFSWTETDCASDGMITKATLDDVTKECVD